MKRKLFTEGGTLNSDGEYFIYNFKAAVRDLLEEVESAEFSAEELALLGSILQAKVGTAVATEISRLKVEKNRRDNHPYWQMSDEEFEAKFYSEYKPETLFTMTITDGDASARYNEILVKKIMQVMKTMPLSENYFEYPQGKDRF